MRRCSAVSDHPEAASQDVEAARHFYDRISSVYDALADASEGACRERGLTLLAPAGGERALELGFGTGHGLVGLARRVGDGGRVVGLDVSEGMAREARKRLEAEGMADRVELRVAEAPPLPFPAASFDVAFASFTLELFPEPALPAVLAELQRVLRPSGRLGVVSMATPGEGESESALSHTYRWLHRHFPHIVDCQPIQIERFLEEAGFELSAQERMSIWTLPVAIVVARQGC
jgi:demethylmenaquinone methyltransferase/2-methoxy-6-polyprenyl-1,4-benzoquinol methylase